MKHILQIGFLFLLVSPNNLHAVGKVGNGGFAYQYSTELLKFVQERLLTFIEKEYIPELEADRVKKEKALYALTNLEFLPDPKDNKKRNGKDLLMFDYEENPLTKLMAYNAYFQAYAAVTPETYVLVHRGLERRLWHELAHAIFQLDETEAEAFADKTVKDCYAEIDRRANKASVSTATGIPFGWRYYQSSYGHKFWISKNDSTTGPYFTVQFRGARSNLPTGNEYDNGVQILDTVKLYLFPDSRGNYSGHADVPITTNVTMNRRTRTYTRNYKFSLSLRELSATSVLLEYDSLIGTWINQTYTLWQDSYGEFMTPDIKSTYPLETTRYSSVLQWTTPP